MSLSVEQAQKVKRGDAIHRDGFCFFEVDPSGETKIASLVWRVSGNPKLWKKDTNRFSIPIRLGSSGDKVLNDRITEESADEWHTEEECPALGDAEIHSKEKDGECIHRRSLTIFKKVSDHDQGR